MTADVFMQVGTLAIGSVGVCVALLNQRRQLNAQMFIEFSGRFQELLRLFPTEAWLANRNPSQPLPPPSQELKDCTLYCIQFIYDAYRLHKEGYISKHLWIIWEREIRRTLSGPLFQREWEAVAAEFSHDREFFEYIRALTHARTLRAPAEARCGASAAVASPSSTGTAARLITELPSRDR